MQPVGLPVCLELSGGLVERRNTKRQRRIEKLRTKSGRKELTEECKCREEEERVLSGTYARMLPRHT